MDGEKNRVKTEESKTRLMILSSETSRCIEVKPSGVRGIKLCNMCSVFRERWCTIRAYEPC